MKIIILGAGRVGESVAASLVSENNEVSVVDINPAKLESLQEHFDLRTIAGDGMDPSILAEAGADDTDLFIACSSQDATNLASCKIASMRFNIPARIARVHAGALMSSEDLMGKDGFAVDRLICPEESLTNYLIQLMEYPEALQVYKFARGRVLLVSVRAVAGARLTHHTVRELREHAPGVPMRLVGIFRRYEDEPDRFIMCHDETRIQPGDEVFVLAGVEAIPNILGLLHYPVVAGGEEKPIVVNTRRITIAGGGRVGFRLAARLAEGKPGLQIRIVENRKERCVELASLLPPSVLVLNGDATDETLLENENIENTDFFLALTQDDENNIMSSLLAKRMGARRVLALINRHSYADLMHGTQIDIALSPAQTVLGELLQYVRQGDVQVAHSVRRGLSEALEIVARGDKKNSRVVGKKVGNIAWPRDVQIGLIVRGMPEPDEATLALTADLPPMEGEEFARLKIIYPTPDVFIESNDHVIMFLPSKHHLKEVEKLFHVGATFF